MKKLLLLLAIIVTSVFATSIVYSAPKLDYNKDWQIGIFKLTNEFDLRQATIYLGEVERVNNEGTAAGATIRGVYFKNGFMSLRNNKVYVIATTVPKMPTHRGVSVGDSLTLITDKYGLPSRTRMQSKDNTCWYIYGSEGAEISFLVANNTSKVIKMVVAFPVC